MILKVSGDSLEKVESEFTKIIDSDMGRNEKFTKLFSLMAEGHAETQSMMKEGFVGLAIQNAELNAELKEQNKALKDQLTQLQDQLAIVTEELQERKERERLVQERKEKWKNRKRLPKREPITREIYDSLIESSQKFKYSNLYQSARLRLALALLLVTGIRISELLPLKMKQVESLFTHNWISIDRAKRGPGNHKAFLTKEGARIMKDRRSDFELLQLWRDSMKEDATFQRDLKRVKNFQHNPRSDRFCSFITAVFRQFEVLEDEECTEQEVKDYVRYILQEIQPYL
jgi:integrase